VKVYLMTDLEGVAGVWEWDYRENLDALGVAEVQRMSRLLTAEVNAAVEGFLEGGATEVIVNDGHGWGCTLDIEAIHPAARVIHGQQRPCWLPLLDESVTATALVGAHAKAGTAGANLCHTMSSQTIRSYAVNGVVMGEIGFQALSAGYYGVPFAFLSGDHYACEETQALLPGLHTVAVKEGLSTRSACCLSPVEARRRVQEGARHSLAERTFAKPFDLGSPLVFREERIRPDFDTDAPPEDARIRVLSSHVREVTAANIFELCSVLYGFPWRV
jgi:D-amino peptidase